MTLILKCFSHILRRLPVRCALAPEKSYAYNLVLFLHYNDYVKRGFVMKVKVLTLGCKVNQFESQAMLRELSENGYEIVGEDDAADVSVINSCAVTKASEQKAVKMIHRLRRENPSSVIVLTGCMAQAFPECGNELPEVDIVLGNKRRSDLIPVLNGYLAGQTKLTMVEGYGKNDPYESLFVDDFLNRTRAYLKIEDGCNRFCSYCIIPYARGRVRSCSLDYIRKEIAAFAGNGYREVVIIGINLSSYGSDNGLTFSDAVSAACESADIRIRLGSLEPEAMDIGTLKKLSGYKNFCPQFHLALQSGCNETLRRMNRHYTTEEYEEIVCNIRSVFDNPSVTTDVMVGFPDETEEEFRRSMEFVRKIGFARVHIFPYSRRAGTVADRAPGQISPEVKKERAALMAQAAKQGMSEFLASQIGRTESVLIETLNKDGFYEGYTMNYTHVHVRSEENISGLVVPVRIISAKDESCFGELISADL